MVGARVSLVPSVEQSIALAVELELIIPGIKSEQAVELARLAHGMRAYYRATQGNIEVGVSASDD